MWRILITFLSIFSLRLKLCSFLLKSSGSKQRRVNTENKYLYEDWEIIIFLFAKKLAIIQEVTMDIITFLRHVYSRLDCLTQFYGFN